MLLVLGAAILWGTTGTAQSFATPTLSAYWIGTFRLLTAAPFLLAWVARSKGGRASLGPRALATLSWPLLLGAAACMTLYNLAFFAGVRASSVAIGTALALGSAPAWAGLLQGLVSRRAPTRLWWLGVGIAVSGLAIALLGASGAPLHAGGAALCLVAGLAYALYARLTKRLIERATASVGTPTAVVFTLAALLALPFALAIAGPPTLLARDVVVLLWLGPIGTGVAYLLFSTGLRSIASATGVALALAEPVAAFGFALLLVGERPGAVAVGGLVVVLAGLAVLVRAEIGR